MMCFSRRCLLLALLVCLVLCPAMAEDKADDMELAIPKPVMQLHQVNISGTMAYVLMDDRHAILIDGGSNITANDYTRKPEQLDAYLASLGIERLDAHIVTHWHNDHSYNIHYFNRLYADESTVLYGVSAAKPERFIMEKGSYRQLRAGDEFRIGPFHFQVLGPERDTVSGDHNADSLNFILTYGSRRFLFTGDYMSRRVLEMYPDEIAAVDVFQFPHHGLQPFCVDQLTLRAVDPKLVLLPGNNRGYVRLYMRECGITPDRDIFSMDGDPGNATVLLCDGDVIEVLPNQKPGDITRTRYPAALEANTTAK